MKDKEAAQAHCQLGANSIFNEEIFNWLDGVMGEGAGATTTAPMFKLHHMGVVVRNLDEAVEIYGPRRGPKIMRKHGIKYSRMHPSPKKVRMAFVGTKTPAEWQRVFDEYYDPEVAYPVVPDDTVDRVAAGAT